MRALAHIEQGSPASASGTRIDEIVDLLRTGVSDRGAVYGPMAEVTFDSLQYLNDADVRAMAIFLKGLAQGTPPGAEVSTIPAPESSLLLNFGQTVYQTHCASCHAADGRGMPPQYPPLAGNPSIQMQSAVNPIRMVLNGGFPPGTTGNPMPYGMPPFAQRLSDDEVAAVVTYIRAAWGNRGTAVSSRQANELRTAPQDRGDHDELAAGPGQCRRRDGAGCGGECHPAIRPHRCRGARGNRNCNRRRTLVRILSSGVRAARGRAVTEALAPASGDDGGERSERAEHHWATVAVIILVVLVVMAVFAGVHQASMPQSRVETADPRTLHLHGEFIESNLGSALRT